MADRADAAPAEAALGVSLEATQEIAGLRLDLKQANALVTAGSEDNERLKKNLAEKNAFIQAQSRSHGDFRQTWKRQQELFQDEKRAFSCEQESWTRRLENIKKEVASLASRATRGPNDNSATSNLLEGMQEEFTKRFESLKAESESWRQRYFECQKKHEGIQAENNAIKEDKAREKETADAYRAEISKLQHSLVRRVEESVKENNGKLSSESVLRDLRQQSTQKELAVERLTAEAKILREARDEAVRAKDEMYAASRSEQGVSRRNQVPLHLANPHIFRRCSTRRSYRSSQSAKRLKSVLRSPGRMPSTRGHEGRRPRMS